MSFKRIYTKVSIVFIILFYVTANAQKQQIENQFQQRIGADFSYKPIKKLKINIEPEIRFNNEWKPDRYLFTIGTDYKVVKYTKLEAEYRFGIHPKKNSTAYLHRYAFGIKLKKKIADFTPSLRVRYTNDADDQTSDKKFIRYKGMVKYDIPKCTVSPFIGVEAFQLLDNGSKLYKMRYLLGGIKKIKKNHYLVGAYRFDFYNLAYKNRHIFSIGYKLNF